MSTIDHCVKDYEFAAAKTKEIDAISASITSKTQRIGELAVSSIDATSASIESKAHRIGELAVSLYRATGPCNIFEES